MLNIISLAYISNSASSNSEIKEVGKRKWQEMREKKKTMKNNFLKHTRQENFNKIKICSGFGGEEANFPFVYEYPRCFSSNPVNLSRICWLYVPYLTI